jgi:putative transposase
MGKRVVRLNSKSKQLVRYLVRSSSTEASRRRYRVLWALGRGLPHAVVAEALDVSLSTVYRVEDLYLEDGVWGLLDGRSHRAPPKVTPEVLEVLEELWKSDPRKQGWTRTTWTCELLGLALAERTGITLHRSWIHVLLRQLKMHWGRPRPSVRHLNPRRWRQWRRIQRKLARLGPREVVLFSDEVDIDLNPRIGFMWMKRGTQTEIPTPGKNQKVYMAGTLNITTGHVVTVEGPNKDSLLFIALLKAVSRAYRWARRIHILADQYSTHFSQATKRVLAKCRKHIVIHPIPTYSPYLNPIERLWKKLHDQVTRNHRFSTMRQLLLAVRSFLRDVVPFKTQNPLLLRKAA